LAVPDLPSAALSLSSVALDVFSAQEERLSAAGRTAYRIQVPLRDAGPGSYTLAIDARAANVEEGLAPARREIRFVVR